MTMRDILIQKINQSNWWHVAPRDPNAYMKRGKFFASTYLQAEFYGRANLKPEKVKIKNPVFGFSENDILIKLFKSTKLSLSEDDHIRDFYKKRIALDAIMHKKAKSLGYDSIVLMTTKGKLALRKGRKPNSIELNIIY